MTESQKDIVLITGASKGIGLATARAVAVAGHTVLLGARDPECGAARAAELAAEGLDARPVALDVTEAANITAAAALVQSEYGQLAVLINNAGISRDRPYAPTELPLQRLRETYETNVFGVVAVTSAMLPLLHAAGAAKIVNISSSLGSIAALSDPDAQLWQYANLLAYNSSKVALNAITLIYAQSLRDQGITVNAIDPGYVATDLNGNAGFTSADDAGTAIAAQIAELDAARTGAFLTLSGETQAW